MGCSFVPSGLDGCLGALTPGLTPWANICRPFRAKPWFFRIRVGSDGFWNLPLNLNLNLYPSIK